MDGVCLEPRRTSFPRFDRRRFDFQSRPRRARIEGGTRDAYICRKHDGSGYLMVTTDMCVAKSKHNGTTMASTC